MFRVVVMWVLVASSAFAETQFEVSGAARVRAEVRDNNDFSSDDSDYKDFTGSRFRLNINAQVNENLSVFFQPQFSKTWGENEYIPSGATANTETGSSGALNDTDLDVHQAYMKYQFSEKWSGLAGRKELAFGDQLVIGSVGWSNVGRSFDLIQANFKSDFGSFDLWDSKLIDRNAKTSGDGDKSFSGLYWSHGFGEHFKTVDLYILSLSDAGLADSFEVLAYGARLRSPVGAFDYRMEATFENVDKDAEDSSESQVDFEVGYIFENFYKTRLSGEYFTSTERYDQMFPTGHKWLGYADLFSRRNISGFRVGTSSQITENLKASLDYHSFFRTDNEEPAYNFSGVAYTSLGDEEALATELDLVLDYALSGGLGVQAGLSWISPEAHFEDSLGEDPGTFSYVELSAAF